MSGSSARRRSVSISEDRPRAIGYRARVAGRVHREPTPRAQRATGGQDRLRLLGEGDYLVVAEPEAHARRVARGALRTLFARRALAGDQDEHPAGFVVAEAHLSDLPLGLARLEADVCGRPGGGLDALRLDHLVQA